MKNIFTKYQKQILWLANSFLGEFIFAFKKMGHYINGKKILKIFPNSICLDLSNGKRQWQFFVRNEYARKLYYKFYPILLLFHLWDTLVANNFVPKLNLGFDAFGPVYPDVHPESTTVDGFTNWEYTGGAPVSWADMRAKAGTGASDVGPIMAKMMTYLVGNYYTQLYRSPILFDISSFTDKPYVDITSIVESVYGYASYDNGIPQDKDRVSLGIANPISNVALASGDFNLANWSSSTMSNNEIYVGDWNNSGYNDFIYNNTGKSFISTDTIIKTGLRLRSDQTNQELTWPGANLEVGVEGRSSDYGSNKPKLVINYTIRHKSQISII